MEGHTFKKGDRFELLRKLCIFSFIENMKKEVPVGATGYIESIMEPGQFGCKAAKVSFDHYSYQPIVMVEKLGIPCNEND